MQAGNSGAARQRSGVPIWSQAAERFPPADRILSTILTRQAARYRDRTLFVFGETRWSYTETAAIAAASAARLMRAGVQAGDRVALMCSNRPEFLEVYLGCAWMGAVTVPINTALRGIQLSHILRNAAPKLLVIEFRLYAGDRNAGKRRRAAGYCLDDRRGRCASGNIRIGLATACTRRGSPARARAAGRHGRDPLYVGHHRSLQGRLLPAGADVLVGRPFGARARHPRG